MKPGIDFRSAGVPPAVAGASRPRTGERNGDYESISALAHIARDDKPSPTPLAKRPCPIPDTPVPEWTIKVRPNRPFPQSFKDLPARPHGRKVALPSQSEGLPCGQTHSRHIHRFEIFKKRMK